MTLYEAYLEAEVAWKISQDAPHTFLDSGSDTRLRLSAAKETALAAWLADQSPSPIEAGETDLDPQSAPVNADEELFKWQTMTPIMQHRMTPPVTLSNTSMGW